MNRRVEARISPISDVLVSVLKHIDRLEKWLLVEKAPLIIFYDFPGRTQDIDLCFFLDPEEDSLEDAIRSIVEEWGLNWRDVEILLNRYFRRGTGIPLRSPFVM